MTEEFLNLDSFDNNYIDSYQYQFTTSRDSGQSSDDTNNQKLHNIPKTKKNISKYEPIYENNIVYRYEDNPDQYKKIRKRLQNRESATRVRGRQKIHVHDLEAEVERIKEENQQLQMVNAKLQAENILLKQQVQFMQSVILKDEPKINPPFEMVREENNQKHIVSLTAFTLILGVIIFNNVDEEQKQAVSSAAERQSDQYIVDYQYPYILIGLIGLWIGYLVYVTYGFGKGRLKKMKII